MKKILAICGLTVVWAALAAAQGTGMGSGGGAMAGSGMIVVADDGSLLITSMKAGGMMGGGSVAPVDRDLVNVDADGGERWRASFDGGWPMMPVTDGDLVVVVLRDDWFIGSGGPGDGGWSGGHMGGPGKADGVGDGESTVVALDLATGAERWRVTVPGDMASMVQFAPDGAQLYVSARDMGNGFGMGRGSIRQGEAAGAGFMFSSTVVAFDRSGNQLWAYELGSR